MRNNETGEFELVVGDRQLLSAFFIVVLLCAVAFAMGYVVGQNAPRSKTTAESAPAPQSNSAADSRPQPLPPAPAPQVAAPPAEASAPQADGTPQPTTQAAQGSESAKPEQKASSAPPPATAAAGGIVAAEDLPSGNFWQVMAVSQQTAEMFRTTLKDHGFNVVLSAAPRGLIRVLVGPYPDTQALGKAKTELEAAGMHPVRYKP